MRCQDIESQPRLWSEFFKPQCRSFFDNDDLDFLSFWFFSASWKVESLAVSTSEEVPYISAIAAHQAASFRSVSKHHHGQGIRPWTRDTGRERSLRSTQNASLGLCSMCIRNRSRMQWTRRATSGIRFWCLGRTFVRCGVGSFLWICGACEDGAVLLFLPGYLCEEMHNARFQVNQARERCRWQMSRRLPDVTSPALFPFFAATCHTSKKQHLCFMACSRPPSHVERSFSPKEGRWIIKQNDEDMSKAHRRLQSWTRQQKFGVRHQRICTIIQRKWRGRLRSWSPYWSSQSTKVFLSGSWESDNCTCTQSSKKWLVYLRTSNYQNRRLDLRTRIVPRDAVLSPVQGIFWVCRLQGRARSVSLWLDEET